MLQLKDIRKEYRTGDLVQRALDGVSLNLRENEFVAILGQSGSGKTTLLNVIGGLDRYDSGDLIINNISTKSYKDRDWDSYRNHTVGFVFQSYNLIPHQSILSNVELALTISGISRSERRKRALKALEDVGLKDHVNKKPNQMSGGQMQRVAIARALVNNPDILLADEPTGALDSETSIQVMELLKEVAQDRLVVMVTHNPELAEDYATRIVRLRDGKIIDDTRPFVLEDEKEEAKHKNMGKSSMSFLTALSLSFNNLKTKKGRTLLTAFAGSIGIIGIALILSLSNGVNNYIEDIQKDTMVSYPITIEKEAMDLASLMEAGKNTAEEEKKDDKKDRNPKKIYSNSKGLEHASTMTTSIDKNNLTAFKKYLDDPKSEIHDYVGDNGIVYSYATKFDIYSYDPDKRLVNADGTSFDEKKEENPFGTMPSLPGLENPGARKHFEELLPGKNDELVSPAIKDNYDLLYGKYPKSYDETILIVDKNNEIASSVLYELGILPYKEYEEIKDKIDRGEEISLKEKSWDFEDLLEQKLYLLPAALAYEKVEEDRFSYVGDQKDKVEDLLDEALELKIVGIIRQKEESENFLINSNLGYTRALTDKIREITDESALVKAQIKNKDTNILNGASFAPKDDSVKIEDSKKWLASLGISDKAQIAREMVRTVYADDPKTMGQLLQNDENSLAKLLDDYLADQPDQDFLLAVYENNISAGSYEENMEAFGLVSLDAPASINIYADSFENKDLIAKAIENYNEKAKEEDKISYTDFVALLMSSITTIINVISYVLIAFVGVSLVVSSIMIGIITYISVLERTKEIGILRAIGASKHNISQVFNAETFIIGLISGALGVGISLLLLIPTNKIIHSMTGTPDVNASLPLNSGLILLVLSVFLTLLGGLIPAKKAAKKDPVTALRTD